MTEAGYCHCFPRPIAMFVLWLTATAACAAPKEAKMKDIVLRSQPPAVVVVGQRATQLERYAAEELVIRLGALGGRARVAPNLKIIDLKIIDSKIEEGDGPLFLVGTPRSNPLLAEAIGPEAQAAGGHLSNEEGFYLKTLRFRGRPTVVIAGGGGKGVLYGVGRFLRGVKATDQRVRIPPLQLADKPVMPLRGIFWAAYATGRDDFAVWCYQGQFDKLRRYLIGLMLHGMNTVCVTYWLDDPGWFIKTDAEARQRQDIAGNVTRIFRELGLKVVYWWPVNTVPRQWWEEHPDLRATEIFGLGGYPAFCPSKPEGCKLILEARRAMFAAMPAFDILHVYPKDVGGCGCAQCKPFHKPYLDLSLATLKTAQRFHPQVELMVNLWYLTAEEEEAEVIPLFLNTPEVTYVGAPVNFNLATDHTGLGFLPYTALPSLACRKRLAAEKRVILWNDITMRGGWGRYGLYPLPRQIKHFYESFPGAIGSLGYTEGAGDYLNKLILLNLAWNPKLSVEEALSAALADGLGPEVSQPMVEAMLAMEVGDFSKARPLLSQAEAGLRTTVREGWRWQLVRMFERNAPVRFEIHRLLRRAAEIAHRLSSNGGDVTSRKAALELARHIASRQPSWKAAAERLARDSHRLYPQVHQIAGTKYPFLYGGPSLLNPTDGRKELDASRQLGIDVAETARAGLHEIGAVQTPADVARSAKKLLDILDGYRYYDDCRSIKDGTMGIESLTPDYGWVSREESSGEAVLLLKATILSEGTTVDFPAPLRHLPPPGSVVRYVSSDFAGKEVLQQGEVTADAKGGLTIAGLRITRTGVRLRLTW